MLEKKYPLMREEFANRGIQLLFKVDDVSVLNYGDTKPLPTIVFISTILFSLSTTTFIGQSWSPMESGI